VSVFTSTGRMGSVEPMAGCAVALVLAAADCAAASPCSADRLRETGKLAVLATANRRSGVEAAFCSGLGLGLFSPFGSEFASALATLFASDFACDFASVFASILASDLAMALGSARSPEEASAIIGAVRLVAARAILSLIS